MSWIVHHADCLDVLPTLDESSIDALVTDPPAGISFMGKGWDSDNGDPVAWAHAMSRIYAACLRVLKPGGHGLVWGLPRTSWATGLALHLAGWEIRDRVQHVFGQGFPKGQDLGRVTGLPEWSGWHTALKPAVEDWWLVRKPLAETSIGRQVVATGTGGLHVDPCRVPVANSRTKIVSRGHYKTQVGETYRGRREGSRGDGSTSLGRFPPHLLLSHAPDCLPGHCGEDCPCRGIGEGGGWSESAVVPKAAVRPDPVNTYSGGGGGGGGADGGADDSGHADRFFPRFPHDPDRLAMKYHGKVTPADRGDGNRHPTVKAAGLMDWLCTLVTPPGGTILDPFTGSGSTGCAAVRGGWSFVGIEREAEYVATARDRIGREAAQELMFA